MTVNPLFNWGSRTYIMGILNITPDSFSGDGLAAGPEDREAVLDRVLVQAGEFVSAGAQILDIGGESTRPGAETVSVDEELARVLPVVETLAQAFPDTVLSIDSYKASVAEAALSAGADMINDIWGLRADPQMAQLAARSGAPIVLMHNRLTTRSAEVRKYLGGRYIGVAYDDLIGDIQAELMESVGLALAAGVEDAQIILDPGIGFGKTVSQNLELLDRLGEMRALGYPLLLGPSRKSFIGYTLNLPPDQRVEGTAAAVAIGIDRGADIVRVHDVAEMARVVRMVDAIVRKQID